MPERTFLLKSQPPIRAFVIAALLSLVGGVCAVLGLQHAWHWTLVAFAFILLAAGVGLFAAALVATARLGVRVTISDDGYEISGTNQAHSGQWADVTKVTQALEGAHITIYHGAVRRTHIIFPGGPAEQRMQDVIDEILSRLERAK